MTFLLWLRPVPFLRIARGYDGDVGGGGEGNLGGGHVMENSGDGRGVKKIPAGLKPGRRRRGMGGWALSPTSDAGG
jgi:hypothetical protein